MSELKLLRVDSGDSQKNLIDKVNFNFSNIIAFGGGPYGRGGTKGPKGNKGINGPKGSYGDKGERGSIWTVGPCQPGITGSIVGDWWMNPANQNQVYKFSNQYAWSPQGFALNGFDLFSVQGPLTTTSGTSNKYGYFFSNSTPINSTFLISDNPSIISGTQSSPNPLPNPQYSKFVISVDGLDVNKKILEFNKFQYLNSGSYNSGTPRFFWSQGPTAYRGNYGLCFTNGSSTTFDFPQGDLNFSSSIRSFYFKSTKFNAYINSSSLFSANALGNISLNFVGGTATFSTNNFSFYGSEFLIKTQFNVTANSNLNQSFDYGLKLSTSNSLTGNLRYFYNSISNQNASLFKATQLGGLLFGVFGNGYVYYDKRVNSIQNAQTITQTNSDYIGPTLVNWTTVLPSISVSSGSGEYYYANNGIDYIISKSAYATSGERGICLWTPAIGASAGFNGGWLNLLEDGESISFRVHSSSSTPGLEDFRFIGLNTSSNQSGAPNGTISNNYSYADLGAGVRATTVDFTIINITGTGSTGSSRRWYRVYYSAWGGSLPVPQCGILQTYNSTA